MKKIRALWQSLWEDVDRRIRMGRVIGLAFIVLGFVLIGFAWNGAAGQNWGPAQFPYLLSGGFMGLGLIVTGATLLFLSTIRSERELLHEQFKDMATLLGRNLSRLQFSSNGSGAPASGEQVVAAASTFHRVGCRVLEGKAGLMTVTVEQAEAEGLSPCRICEPPVTPAAAEQSTPDETAATS